MKTTKILILLTALMSVEKYEKDEQIKKVRPMNTGREGEI